jgi:hypothetical protein
MAKIGKTCIITQKKKKMKIKEKGKEKSKSFFFVCWVASQ